MTKKFEVPYNFDSSLVEQLIPYKEYVDFLYMPSFHEDGTNSRKDLIIDNKVPATWEDYVSHVERIQQEFSVGVLIQHGATLELIDKYYSIGIRIFVLNDNDLVIKAKEKYNDIICILSITSCLSFEDITNNDYSMYDEITLFFNFCRQIHLLQELPKEYKYVLIPNSHCVYKCDRCLAHWALQTDTGEEYIEEVSKITGGYCNGVYREDRAFIHPSDLSYFDEYVYVYKLVDRLMETPEIIYEIDRYTKTYEDHKQDMSWYVLDTVDAAQISVLLNGEYEEVGETNGNV